MTAVMKIYKLMGDTSISLDVDGLGGGRIRGYLMRRHDFMGVSL